MTNYWSNPPLGHNAVCFVSIQPTHHSSNLTSFVAKDLKNKYEAIPAGERSVAHTGFLNGSWELWSIPNTDPD